MAYQLPRRVSEFSLAVIVYALSKDAGDVASPSDGSTGVTIASTIACVLAAVTALTWLAVDGTTYLPAIYVDTLQQSQFAINISILLWAINIAGFVLLFVRRRTILDFWLIVILFV